MDLPVSVPGIGLACACTHLRGDPRRGHQLIADPVPAHVGQRKLRHGLVVRAVPDVIMDRRQLDCVALLAWVDSSLHVVHRLGKVIRFDD